MGKTMRISVQIGGFRRKIRIASTYGIYVTDTWLWPIAVFLKSVSRLSLRPLE
jgi:hypothetical protein